MILRPARRGENGSGASRDRRFWILARARSHLWEHGDQEKDKEKHGRRSECLRHRHLSHLVSLHPNGCGVEYGSEG